MALRVGIDLTEVGEVARSVEDFGERYLDRVFTPQEQEDCAGAVERLAARVAAKEATLKVLRPTAEEAVPWADIEVVRDPSGWVSLSLSGSAAALATAAGLEELALSLSHEGDKACAVVVANYRP